MGGGTPEPPGELPGSVLARAQSACAASAVPAAPTSDAPTTRAAGEAYEITNRRIREIDPEGDEAFRRRQRAFAAEVAAFRPLAGAVRKGVAGIFGERPYLLAKAKAGVAANDLGLEACVGL